MLRTLEPEIMDDSKQCLFYYKTDRSAVKSLFIQWYKTLENSNIDKILDIGCGPGDLTLEVSKLHLDATIDAIDASASMLACCEQTSNITYKNIRLENVIGSYDRVISSLTLHHLHNPNVFWNKIKEINPCDVFVFDFLRPETEKELTELVEIGGPYPYDVVKFDFEQSLRAAFSRDELQEQLTTAGLQLNIAQIKHQGKPGMAIIHGKIK